eukprot:14099413-Alexandrium_andersonii.AAC.1
MASGLDAPELASQLHGRALRLLAAHFGIHFEGLAAAVCNVPSILYRTRRRLLNLDTASGILRTKPFCDGLLQDLVGELAIPLEKEE